MLKVAEKLAQRLWNSPTFTSWGSIAVTMASFTLVLPQVLRQFSEAELAVWYLFSTIIGLQLYFELGFSPTFQRLFAFAMGGATKPDLAAIAVSKQSKPSGQPNWETLEAIFTTTRVLFFRIGLAVFAFMATAGTALLIIPIGNCENQSSAWMAWSIMATTTALLIYAKSFRCYLIGTNHIALQKRWAICFGITKTVSNCVVLLAGGGILALVISQQFWSVVSFIRDYFLSRYILDGRARGFQSNSIDPTVLAAAWPAAWRSAIGHILGRGLLTISSLIIAQFAASSILATYLLAINLMNRINQLSFPPFYSKLPTLAKRRAAGQIESLTKLSQRGMVIAYGTFILGFTGLGIAGPILTEWIGSSTKFPSASFWVLIGTAYFLERYGAMHLQLFSTTNKIIWHWVTLGYAVVYCLVVALTMSSLGVYCIPLAMLLGYLFFYVPVSVWHSYKSVNLNFWTFERATLFPAVIAFLCSSAFVFFIDSLSKP